MTHAKRKYERILGLARMALLFASKTNGKGDAIVIDALESARTDVWQKRIVKLSTEQQKELAAALLETCYTLFDEAHADFIRHKVDEFHAPAKVPTMPRETPVFGDDLAAIIRPALDKLELLNAAGQFIGKPVQVKALFIVLKRRGHILGTAKAPDKAFSNFFHAYFDFRVTDRTLRDEKVVRGQDEAIYDFGSYIPDRKP